MYLFFCNAYAEVETGSRGAVAQNVLLCPAVCINLKLEKIVCVCH